MMCSCIGRTGVTKRSNAQPDPNKIPECSQYNSLSGARVLDLSGVLSHDGGVSSNLVDKISPASDKFVLVDWHIEGPRNQEAAGRRRVDNDDRSHGQG